MGKGLKERKRPFTRYWHKCLRTTISEPGKVWKNNFGHRKRQLVDYISKPLINLFDSIIDDKFNVYINKINVDYEPIEKRCYVSVDYVRDYKWH